jgi:hypothetical protein
VDHLLHHQVHRQCSHLVNDKDLVKLVRHQCVVDSFQFHLYLLDVVHLDALQNLDEQNLDVHLSFLDEVRQLILLVVAVDVEVRHLMKTDYFLDVVVQDVVLVELRHLMRTDYFLVCSVLDEELQVLLEFQLRQLLLLQLQLSLPHEML